MPYKNSEMSFDPRRMPHPGYKHRWWDLAVLGLGLGVIFPILGLLVLYWAQGDYWDLKTYIGQFTNLKSSRGMKAASKLVSLSVVFNLIPFYFFLNKKAMQAVKGVVIASALGLLLVVLYLFVWQ